MVTLEKATGTNLKDKGDSLVTVEGNNGYSGSEKQSFSKEIWRTDRRDLHMRKIPEKTFPVTQNSLWLNTVAL